MRDFLNDMQVPVRGYSPLRRALSAPTRYTASDVADKDRTARRLGTSFGMADAGGLAGTLYSSWNSEEGAFAADMLLERDDLGNYLDETTIRNAASLYGGSSGLVEALGEGLTFKLLGPVVKSVKGAFGKSLVRDAVKEAASNKALRPVFRSFLAGAGKAAAIEGGQEFVQEGLSAQIEAATKNLLTDTGTNYYRERQAGPFPAKAWLAWRKQE